MTNFKLDSKSLANLSLQLFDARNYFKKLRLSLIHYKGQVVVNVNDHGAITPIKFIQGLFITPDGYKYNCLTNAVARLTGSIIYTNVDIYDPTTPNLDEILEEIDKAEVEEFNKDNAGRLVLPPVLRKSSFPLFKQPLPPLLKKRSLPPPVLLKRG